MTRLTGLILAPGLGTRLMPFTASRPKALVPIWGRPILSHQLGLLAAIGVEDVGILVREARRGAAEEIGAAAGPGGLRARALWVRHPAPHGFPCPDTLAAVREHVRGATVVTMNCDLLFGRGWRGALEAHRARGADMTIGAAPPQAGIGRAAIGCWVVEEDGWLRCHHRERQPGTEEVIEVGFSVAGPRIWELAESLELGSRDPWADELIPAAIERGLRIQTWSTRSYWRDVGTWPRVLQAQIDIGADPTAFGLGAGGPARIAQGATVAEGAAVAADAYVGEGAVVERGSLVERSILLAGARVGAGAQVRRSVVLPGGVVPAGARLADELVSADGSSEPFGPESDALAS